MQKVLLILLGWTSALLFAKGSTLQSIWDNMSPAEIKWSVYPTSQSVEGKVMCGYQGWFSTPEDGAGLKWRHYDLKAKFEPGYCSIDLWPDVRELPKENQITTKFKYANGEAAQVFSSYHQATVVKHFEWMKTYGIDGVFLQRFGVSLKSPKLLDQRNKVLKNVQVGANRYDRNWCLMYDLSGLKKGEIYSVVIQDWKRLFKKMKITQDPRYQWHHGKPLVAIWGVGFTDRDYTLEECEFLIEFLKNNPEYGNMSVMLGVPTYWRDLHRDSVSDSKLHDLIKMVDVVSPWSVGRYQSPLEVKTHSEKVIKKDLKWSQDSKVGYMPVVFPGFSWYNLSRYSENPGQLNQIPRLGGRFLWSQASHFYQAGANMLYVAMFDEIDEGTAIFKCRNDVPVGKSPFLSYEGQPSDHYLWLTGEISRHYGSQIPMNEFPKRSQRVEKNVVK